MPVQTGSPPGHTDALFGPLLLDQGEHPAAREGGFPFPIWLEAKPTLCRC